MDVRSINLNLLVALDALLTERSVTAAGKLAGVSQPAMSHSLAQLRSLFGDPLLVRGGLLTPLAASLHDQLRQGLAELQQVLDTRQTFDAATSSRVFRVAASDLFQATTLPSFLHDLQQRAPGANLVMKRSRDATVDALATGAVDVLAGSEEQRPGPRLRSAELYRERFVAVARDDHPAIRSRLGISTYCKLPHVLVAEDEDPGTVDRVLASEGRRRRVWLRIPDFAGLGHVIANTDAVATVPARFGAALAARLPLRVLRLPLKLPSFPVSLYWHPRFDVEPAHVFLRERLLALV